MTRITSAVLVLALSVLSAAQSDRDVLARIRTEGLEHSQVAPVFDMFTVTIGPRLTASPAHKRAAEWARDRLASYGLENARLEPWKFGRGWELHKLTLELIEPRYLPLLGYADGWSPSTGGEIVAAPLFIGGKSVNEVEAMRAQLKGASVMSQPMMTNFVRKDRPQPSDPAYVPGSAAYATSVGRGAQPAATVAPAETPAQRGLRILRESGVGVILRPSVGEHGTVFVTGRDGGPGAVPSISMSGEHYNMIARMLQQNIPVKLRVNVQSTFYDADGGNAYNVVAELPGTDPALRDEVVMIGGHLDSWHTEVGATDNADGSTTVMEAMRILKAIGARPRRTNPRRAVGRRRAGAARIEGLGRAAPGRRRQRRRAREVRRLFQHRQRHGPHLRLVPAEQRGSPADLRQLGRALEGPRRPAQRDRVRRLHRSSELHRRRRRRLQSDSGLQQLRHPHPPHEHGHGRSRGHQGHPPGRHRHGDVRVSDRHAGSEAAEAGPVGRVGQVGRWVRQAQRFLFGLCAALAVVCALNPQAQEREDRTLLTHDQMRAIVTISLASVMAYLATREQAGVIRLVRR